MRHAEMFEVDASSLIEGLERIGAHLCQYGGDGDEVPWIGRRCDCKYGATFRWAGEDSGCPEIRQVIKWLRDGADAGAATHAGQDRPVGGDEPVSDAVPGGPSMPNPHLVVQGWRTECVCGYITPLRPTYEESYGDRARHFANHHLAATGG